MPFIKINTNEKVSVQQAEQIKSALGQAITAVPGKSEGWLMVSVSGEQQLYFRGTDEPAAIAEVSLYGEASPAAYNRLTAAICEIYGEELDIPAGNIYVKYEETDHWGWNGSNF